MAANRLRIALGQLNLLVGDVAGNAARIARAAERACGELGADLLVLPELTLCGYPPEDLLFHRGFRVAVEKGMETVRAAKSSCGIVLGFPEYAGSQIFNSAALIEAGTVRATHRKSCLPNYKVFDEKRYFKPGAQPTVVEFRGFRIGILVCEDIWEPEPAQLARSAGAEMFVVLNASPFEIRKQANREDIVRRCVNELRLPVVYVNMLGGQDELVFDGNSFVMDGNGTVVMRAPPFEEDLYEVEFERVDGVARPIPGRIAPEVNGPESVYRALVMGVRDYVGKHGFPGVVMGLSGGIDSALTLAIAVDALGKDRVHAVMMPSPYTSQMSLDDARGQAKAMGVKYSVLPISEMMKATEATLAGEFAGTKPDATEENIQSRCRMLLLMGISNKTGKMLLTTGNKSEMAVGYATLYGDMAGGFAPIKDCSKLLVYKLAEYRNKVSPVIPARVIERPPSAELRPDQKDSDSLPPYEVLDPILEAFIEDDLSVDEICARGFDRPVVVRVLDLVKRNEYKRRQAPPGVRVSRRAFGRDWRYPITSGYRR
ncbi:MAG TPA: NAD+ synthase [Steroidobacteraceae bacterium]|nr:NAD+ synthase [Steroidobacteraceae bacterium]